MENLSIISIYCGGVLSLLMSLFHIRFFKIFKWKNEFEKISKSNKNILYTIHMALILLFFGISALTLIYAKELSLSMGISFGLNITISLFWLWRTIWQVLYFKPDKKSKLFPLHYLLIVYFALLFLAYLIPLILKIV